MPHPHREAATPGPLPPAITLTDRDLTFLKNAYLNRAASSDELVGLTEGSPAWGKRRLRRLADHGYLISIKDLTLRHGKGRRPTLYGIGNRGAQALETHCGLPATRTDWERLHRESGANTIPHARLVTTIMGDIHAACRQSNGHVRLIDEEEILRTTARRIRWRVRVSARGRDKKLTVVPDRIFGLEFKDAPTTPRLFFFLEADRGTEPIIRSDVLDQTSIYRKILAYGATYAQDLHHHYLGFQHFRVLTITNGTGRVSHMAAAYQHARQSVMAKWERVCPPGVFLFTDRGSLNPMHLLAYRWIDGTGQAAYVKGMPCRDMATFADAIAFELARPDTERAHRTPITTKIYDAPTDKPNVFRVSLRAQVTLNGIVLVLHEHCGTAVTDPAGIQSPDTLPENRGVFNLVREKLSGLSTLAERFGLCIERMV